MTGEIFDQKEMAKMRIKKNENNSFIIWKRKIEEMKKQNQNEEAKIKRKLLWVKTCGIENE